jgi:hypothetical protein
MWTEGPGKLVQLCGFSMLTCHGYQHLCAEFYSLEESLYKHEASSRLVPSAVLSTHSETILGPGLQVFQVTAMQK